MTEDLREYATSEHTVADDAKEWIDARVHSGLTKAYHGMLQMAVSGFGKGLLATAAIAVLAIVATTVIAPAAPAFSLALNNGLTAAGNWLLGSTTGLLTLAAGGVLGSMASAYSENTRLNKDNAEEQARYFEMLRQKKSKAPTLDVGGDNEQCRGGHCQKLAQKRKHKQQMQATR